jgi:hypothetical protein
MMKRIPVLLLVCLSFVCLLPAKAQIFMGPDSARRAQQAGEKEQKKARKRQRKAMKQYQKAQRKAAKAAKKQGRKA